MIIIPSTPLYKLLKSTEELINLIKREELINRLKIRKLYKTI